MRGKRKTWQRCIFWVENLHFISPHCFILGLELNDLPAFQACSQIAHAYPPLIFAPDQQIPRVRTEDHTPNGSWMRTGKVRSASRHNCNHSFVPIVFVEFVIFQHVSVDDGDVAALTSYSNQTRARIPRGRKVSHSHLWCADVQGYLAYSLPLNARARESIVRLRYLRGVIRDPPPVEMCLVVISHGH